MNTLQEDMAQDPMRYLEVLAHREKRCHEELAIAVKIARLRDNQDFKAFLADQDLIMLDAAKMLNHNNGTAATGALKLLQGYAAMHDALDSYTLKAEHAERQLENIKLQRDECTEMMAAEEASC